MNSSTGTTETGKRFHGFGEGNVSTPFSATNSPAITDVTMFCTPMISTLRAQVRPNRQTVAPSLLASGKSIAS
ncbi:MAG: hypothetical protein WBB25_05340 [Sulfitobacter sp.]